MNSVKLQTLNLKKKINLSQEYRIVSDTVTCACAGASAYSGACACAGAYAGV